MFSCICCLCSVGFASFAYVLDVFPAVLPEFLAWHKRSNMQQNVTWQGVQRAWASGAAAAKTCTLWVTDKGAARCRDWREDHGGWRQLGRQALCRRDQVQNNSGSRNKETEEK